MRILTMNILLYDVTNSFLQYDIEIVLKELGHKVKNVSCPRSDMLNGIYENPSAEALLNEDLKSYKWDIVMTNNFFPFIAEICHKTNIPYVSWCYDSPMNLSDESSMAYATNKIFHFDRYECARYNAMGFDNVHHIPLAVNISRLDKVPSASLCISDVSLIGQVYDSKYPAFRALLSPRIKGFLDGICQAQQKIYGFYMIDEMLTDEILAEINNDIEKSRNPSLQPTKRQISYLIATHLTHIERLSLLKLSAEICDTKLYTISVSDNDREILSKVSINKPVSYETEMPSIFKSSKINLCPTHRAIRSGIPLRSLDIMACKGFLLSNYQPELAEYFENEQDCIMYDSFEDAIEKIKFYLAQDDERERIAANGRQKIEENFNLKSRLLDILSSL